MTALVVVTVPELWALVGVCTLGGATAALLGVAARLTRRHELTRRHD